MRDCHVIAHRLGVKALFKKEKELLNVIDKEEFSNVVFIEDLTV